MKIFLKLFVRAHVALFRLSGGRLGSAMGGQELVLLTTTGAKTGKKRTVPVMAFNHEGRKFVIASFAGSPEHPAWFKNLSKTPDVTVEMRGKRYNARAEAVAGEERKRLYKLVVEVAPGFGAYEKKAGAREIPVVELKPI